jgi:serine phosphatase RsbU (regulator of sigma subunit)
VIVILALVRRTRLDHARWTVAIAAFVYGLQSAVYQISWQGSRFTHWTLHEWMDKPLFRLAGSSFSIDMLTSLVQLLAILYAVVLYTMDHYRRQATAEREIANARELQQVLVPEATPELPGFVLTSAYQPAKEVGGDFFQIVPVGGGATLIVVGDVSGKGLKAAMTVSLLVGAIRSLATVSIQPEHMLDGLNRLLAGRGEGRYATCVALRLEPDGHCQLASAGHPAPLVNGCELELPGSLPLGLDPEARYSAVSLHLETLDRMALYTDGLPEARNAGGELYGFERTRQLLTDCLDAHRATLTASRFGQEDDMTVLTLTRVESTL